MNLAQAFCKELWAEPRPWGISGAYVMGVGMSTPAGRVRALGLRVYVFLVWGLGVDMACALLKHGPCL